MQGWRYKYYIFLDDDVEVLNTVTNKDLELLSSKKPYLWDVSGWSKFEVFLDQYEPAVGATDYKGQMPSGIERHLNFKIK